MAAPDFWDNPESAQTIVGQLKQLKATIEPLKDLIQRSEDAGTMLEMLAEEEDPQSRTELDEELTQLAQRRGQSRTHHPAVQGT